MKYLKKSENMFFFLILTGKHIARGQVRARHVRKNQKQRMCELQLGSALTGPGRSNSSHDRICGGSSIVSYCVLCIVYSICLCSLVSQLRKENQDSFLTSQTVRDVLSCKKMKKEFVGPKYIY